ncbi:hypothetical protein MJO28_007375 [Puccinia striiformis f. sp. tritici]|uniref:Uncharacterized protein n=2 Tax=Puccinia striiformis f. sp. tritici TaxID=168172 RepID=A0A0L0VW38_9BASI|nr:hypothetical protein Pst134EB_014464 [Puccinia striiformis f. sp. tritici]KAI9603863.1 hypothetical protein H4Q26_003467 [Puccinia striiformis f. sp. tritici PST-130]KNF03422.1 hypothetical protein PSTG_03363 [Puccinia striiformis f. sp. tritici PST-78]KAI7933230.1 hypothetical protein MJO29_016976 [Puccinia striiformis f. sp. tritici]KAI7951691.1 hypothetical protein MJO28_007375 [Puccinia striiformis f. sp. tritici]
MADRHVIRLNNCVTIVVWLTAMDPARHYPRRDFSMIIITVPSRFGLMAFKVTSRRTGALAIRPSMWRISWGDPEVPESSRVISEHLIQRVEAFTQRMWGNQGGYLREHSSGAGWLLDVLRREFRHNFFDHQRLHLVIEIIVSLLNSDE